MTVSASPGRHHPPLSPLRRAEAERADPALIARLRRDPSSRVLVVRADALPLADGAPRTVAPREVPEGAEWAFLGRDDAGRGMLLAALDPDHPGDLGVDVDGWGALRALGGELAAGDAAVFATAVALGRWLRDAAYCPACGSPADLRGSGWSRLCPVCGREHFPRTDPAVIVAVTRADDPDALLLGSNALWGAERYSCFAGFAEAGEPLEETVVREVHEEAGVTLGEVRYIASQPWPYPRSLMLGFRAVALDPLAARPDGEEIVSVRWFTRAEIGAGLAGVGDVQLPGPSSIAHRLIRQWHAEGE